MILVAYLLLLLKLRKGGVIHPLLVQEFYLSYFTINMSPHLTLKIILWNNSESALNALFIRANSTYWTSVKSVWTCHGSGCCHWYPRPGNVKQGVYKHSQGRYSPKYLRFSLSLSLHQQSTFIHSSIANSIQSQ